MKKQQKIINRIIAGVLLVAVIIVSAALFISGSDGRNYRKHIDLAQRYIDELQYEQAIAEYEAAIRIDPNNAETYQALADLYVLMENYESAAEILGRGIEQTESEILAVRLEEVQVAHEEQKILTAVLGLDEVDQEGSQEEIIGQEREKTREDMLVGAWRREGRSQASLVLYDNGTCELQGEDELGTWSISGNTLRLANKYGKSESHVIAEIADGKLVVTDWAGEDFITYWNIDGVRESRDYREDGSCSELYEYDENGNLVKDTEFDADGAISRYWIWERDENGNCVKRADYNAEWMISSTVYEYDENGNCVKETDYNADEVITESTVYEYDENGNCVKHIIYNMEEGIMTEYDEYGNGKVTKYDEGGSSVE